MRVRFSRSSICSLVMAMFIVALSPWTNLAADNVWSVQKLNDSKPWDRFIDSPIAIHVEGRIGNFGGGQLRLQRCDVKFTVDNAKLRSVQPKSTVQVTGRFKKDNGKLEFIVEDVKVVQGYVEQFESRVLKLKRATAPEWMELGDWAAKLGKFYDDADLTAKANFAYGKAIDVEYEALKATDSEGRFALAKKVLELKLSPRRGMEFIHEALRIEWQNLQKADTPDPKAWEKFAENLSGFLSGTKDPLPKVSRDLKEAYEQDPVATFRKSNEEARTQLHRLFFVAVTRKRLLEGASSDGRDGEAIAEKIEQLIPEEAELAEEQRVAHLSYRIANVATATRPQVESLATALRERNRNEAAKQSLTQWIKSHELRLKGDGVVGLMRLADEYLTLLNQESVAVEYLTDAHRIDPGNEDVKKKLASLGYQWQKSRWMKVDPAQPQPTATAAQSPSGIVKDMTATELKKLLGQPGSLSRAVTSRGITEVWSFGPVGGSRLVVRLEQKGRDTEPKVQDYANLQ